MINLRRLQSIGEKSSDEGLRRVVDYILAKIQRDKTEFSRYNYDEDWIEFDHYLSQLPRHNRGLNVLRKVIHENQDEEYINDSFERTLLQHLNRN